MLKQKKQIVLVLALLFTFGASTLFAADCGDVNGSGTVDIVDGLLIAKYYVNTNPAGFDPSVADVNNDGAINIVDALLIAQFYVNLINSLNCGSTPTPTETPATPTPDQPQGIRGNQVAVIGESFIAMSQITQNLQNSAKSAGLLPQGDSFSDKSESGTRLSGGGGTQIPQQYVNANPQKTVKWVFMDGGGNDCLQGSCSNPPNSSCSDLVNAVNAARTLFAKMSQDGVKKVIYFFYPEPLQMAFPIGDLKARLDVLRPMMKQLVDSTTSPKIYWLDLRPVWNGHNEYTSDGIHPTAAGSKATADAIWNLAQEVNFFTE
ncbi:MAG: hypothetical protein JXR70_06155 [Spirochaetales bacterium]|nr:hypothetical protein [Spirochaetales bacterium]